MTIEEANKIVNIWGKYLEHVFGKLNTLFYLGGKVPYIPESLLPYPKTMLDEALIIMEKHYFDTENKKGIELMRESRMTLEFFGNDEETITHTGQAFVDPEKRKRIISSIKDWQGTWPTTQ